MSLQVDHPPLERHSDRLALACPYLSAVHNAEGLPVSAMIGTTFAVVITMGIIIAMQFLSGKKKGGGQGITTRFMGLIIVAMGLQFMLDGIKDFF